MAAAPTYDEERYRGLRYSYDPSVDALYVYLSEQPHARTVALDDARHIDYDGAGAPTGVELLSPRAIGVDLRAVPEAAALAGLLTHLGFRVTAGDVSQTDPAVPG